MKKGCLIVFTFLCVALTACGFFGGEADEIKDDGGLGGECRLKNDCSEQYICAGGSCQLVGTVGLGGSCWATRDCTKLLFCSSQAICSPMGEGGEGAECATGAECKRSLVCEIHGFGGHCAQSGDVELGEICEDNGDCIAGLVCGPDNTCGNASVVYPVFEGVVCEEDKTEFKSYFEVPKKTHSLLDFYRLPFPNDIRVSTDGKLNMSDFPRPGQSALGVDIVGLYVDALVDDFTGFSAVAPIAFRFSRELEFASIGIESIHYIDITPGATELGNDRSRNWGYSTGKRLYNCQHLLTVVSPSHQPLMSGHTYAVFLTNDIQSADGVAIKPDVDFSSMLMDARPAGLELAHAWDVYAPFRAYLARPETGFDPSDISVATVFTVQDLTGKAEALAKAVEASKVPVLTDLTLCDGSNTSPCEDKNGRGACTEPNDDFYEVHGRFSVPVYQNGTAPYESPADGGAIVYVDGVPQERGEENVCFVLTIPKTEKPVGGWPLSVYGHGTGGAFTGVVKSGIAKSLAKATPAIAMFSFDGVVHGERKKDSSRRSDSLMFNVVNPQAARDNILQGGVDVLQALRITELGTLAVPGVGDVHFDVNSRMYIGHSQGANVGIPAIASSDLAKTAVFSGAGAHLTLGMMKKTSPINSRAALEALIGEELSTGHPIMVIWQTFFDSVDTLHYAPLLLNHPPEGLSSKNLFMSWAKNDSYSPEATLSLMAKSMSLPVVSPVLKDLSTGIVTRPVFNNKTGGDGEQRTSACFQYEPGEFDGHFVALKNEQARIDWMAFLTSAIGGSPMVP